MFKNIKYSQIHSFFSNRFLHLFKLNFFKIFLIFSLCGSASAQTNPSPEKFNNDGFLKWVENFKPTALSQGIDEKLFQETFANIYFDESVLKHAKYQPEFTLSAKHYLDRHITKNKILKGVELAKKWKDWLIKIEERFGVPYPYLLAIWSMESNYGAVFKNPYLLKDAITSLASLAYADPKRRKYAKTQLIAALKILQKGEITRPHLLGSWAGALGYTQFIPTSYLQYGVDMDNDGKVDIWSSVPDALATAANLLAQNKWKRGEGWGFEIAVPDKNFPKNTSHSLKEWHDLNIQKINGDSIEPLDLNAKIKIFESEKNLAFLLLHNFYVIKAYNNSDLYALSVGLLGDLIAQELKEKSKNTL